MSDYTPFLELALKGKVLYDEVDNFVDAWHENDKHMSLSSYLGMTSEEYSAWIVDPDVIPQIITARRFSIPLGEQLSTAYEQRLAARSGDADQMAAMKRWLDQRQKKTNQR